MNVEAAEPTEPANPLRGRNGRLVELLQSLDDGELHEYCRYWEWQRERLRDRPFAAWKCSNILSAGKRELRRRKASATGRR
ncbi:MAG: hypothetical protein ACLFRT_13780 [Actinomycetota bacterium]